MRFEPHAYQRRAIDWLVERPAAALFLDMGLGKTAVTLTALQELRDMGEVGRVLVVAPRKVAEATWTDELGKWDHLSAMTAAVAVGTPRQRERAIERGAVLTVVSRDSMTWLLETYGTAGRWPFDTVVLDELTSFKNPSSGRFKAFRRLRPLVRRVIGLTGTPSPNGLEDLWAEVYCLDGGERLGRAIGRYRAKYFTTYAVAPYVDKYTPRPGAAEEIAARISDVCLTMRAADYLELPERIERTVACRLAAAEARRYKDFEREMVMQLERDETGQVLAASAGALVAKLGQFAGGAVYDTEGGVHEVHRQKLEALAELIESVAPESVLVFYQYRHEAERIEAMCRGRRVRRLETADDVRAWNEGGVDVLLAHPASAAFGLNMQRGGRHVAWFGTGWNMELYEQANARLYRQGQTRPVTVTRLVVAGTVDERALAAIEGKQRGQAALMSYVERLAEDYGHVAR